MTYYRTEIVIWSDFDPTGVELADLAREATDGEAIAASVDREAFSRAETLEHDEIDSISHFFPDLGEGSGEGEGTCQECGQPYGFDGFGELTHLDMYGERNPELDAEHAPVPEEDDDE